MKEESQGRLPTVASQCGCYFAGLELLEKDPRLDLNQWADLAGRLAIWKMGEVISLLYLGDG